MAWVITVNGTDRSSYFLCEEGMLTISRALNQRAVLHARASDPGSTLRPEPFQVISVVDDGTTRFAGVVLRVARGPHESSPTQTLIEIDAVDYNFYFDLCVVDAYGLTTGDTLFDLLTDLASVYFADYAITLSGSQADPGYTFTGDQRWDRVTLKALLDDVSALSGHLGAVDFSKVYRMVALANAPAAAWNITDAAPAHARMTVTRLGDEYTNYVQVECGRPGDRLVVTDHWGPGWTAGADTTGTVLDLYCHFYPVTEPPPGYVTVDGNFYPCGIYPGDMWSTLWMWQRPLTASDYGRLRYGPGPLLTNAVVSVDLNVRAPFIVIAADTAEVLAKKPLMRRVLAPGIVTHPAGKELAAASLVRGIAGAQQIVYTTTTDGLEVGTVQHIENSAREVDGDFMITAIETAVLAQGAVVRHTVTAVDQDSCRASWLDRWQRRGVGA